MPIPDFLHADQQIEIPVGAAFAPTGFIAQWVAGVYYSFWTEIDFPKEDYGWDKRRQTNAGNYWYYFSDRAKANAAYEETGGEYNASPIWQWAAKSDTVLNFRGDDIQDTFGPLISRETGIRTLRSGKSRHELHMISLPAAVAAMAAAYGYDTPGFPLDELLKPVDEILWTDDFQRDMVGNSDVGYADSILWKRRAALWKALGEEDARMWQPMDTGTKWDTASKQLHNCLAILHSPWKDPIFARVYFIPDPRVDAIYQSGGDNPRRLTRPALAMIYTSKGEAQAAASEEMGTEGQTSVSRPFTPTGGPALPAGYEEFESDWIETMQGLKAEHGEKVPPPPVLAGELKRLLVKYEDVKAWWEVV